MAIDLKQIKKLREETEVSIADCRTALEESKGDYKKALEWLKKRGIEKAGKKADRATAQGLVESYIHANGKVGVLLTILCETDFVARTEDFKHLAHEVAMQIAAMNPVAVDKDFVSAATIAQEIEIGKEQARRDGKPEEMLEKIAQGKLAKFFKESTLLNQDFVKDNKMTIKQYLQSMNKELTVTDFKRYSLNL